MPVPGIVMASASLNLRAADWDALVTCELGLVRPGGSRISFGQPVEVEIPQYKRGPISLTGGLTVPNSGDYYVNVVCKGYDFSSGNDSDRPIFASGSLIAWGT